MGAWLPLPFLAEHVSAVIAAREAELRVEQASHGLDVVKEVALHALLAAGLAAHYRVATEIHYPSATGKLSHRQRCDLVISSLAAAADGDSALWLEVKVAQQFAAGGRRNPRYATQWRRAITADLRKMNRDPRIQHAALAFVVFTADEATLARDLDAFERMLCDEELLAGTRSVRSVPIVDRIGHTLASIAIWPTLG